jgi:Tol biopolymer transport system component
MAEPLGTKARRLLVLVLVATGCSGAPSISVTPSPTSPAPESPAGQIAFSSDRDGNAKIYLVNADGTGLKRLTDGPGEDIYPAWSPDGTKIAFASSLRDDFDDLDIYMMNADGSGLERPARDARDETQPAWAPDGAKIAFVIDTF